MSFALTEQQTDDLLYVLDDADRLVGHRHGKDLLETWQRLHLTRLALGGDEFAKSMTKEPRKLELSDSESIKVRYTITFDWLCELGPIPFRDRVHALLEYLGGVVGAPWSAKVE